MSMECFCTVSIALSWARSKNSFVATYKKGIIADVTSFVYEQKGNIQYIDQYVDKINMRMLILEKKTKKTP